MSEPPYTRKGLYWLRVSKVYIQNCLTPWLHCCGPSVRQSYIGERAEKNRTAHNLWREQGRCGDLDGNGPFKLIYLSS